MKYTSEKEENEESTKKYVLAGQMSVLVYVLGTVSFVFTILLMVISSRVCSALQNSKVKSDNMKIYNLCL